VLSVLFDSNNNLQVYAFTNASGYYFQRVSSAVYRDPSAWYHLVVQFDPDNGTSANRIIAYINGQQVSWGTSSDSGAAGSISSSAYRSINNTYRNDINGGYQGGGAPIYFGDGYLAETIMVSGSLVSVSSFGETSTTTGVWIPKKYTGTYGTNGFYLPFTDNSVLTTSSNVGLGKDFSGNANYWTTNNISITSGTTYDSMTDVPTLTSATAANYAVLNPLAMYGTNAVISNANLTSSATSTSNDRGWASTIAAPNSGKWYAEFTFTSTSGDNNGGCGIMLENGTGVPGESATTVSWRDFGTLRQNASSTSYGSALVANDVVIVAYDAALGRVWFGKNGTWFASGDPATNANPSATGITTTGRFATYHYNTVAVIQANFGQRPFAYTPPTGFVALNTFNLPTPTIGATASSQANKYFDATTFDGVTGGGTVTNSGSMQPDFVWMKVRNNANNHELADSVRGTPYASFSNLTNAEVSDTRVSAFNSNGFSYGTNSNSAITGRTVVGWQWRASNTTAVTNTAGSITSTVSANTSAGFSIVTATTPASYTNYTAGHGLGVTPSMIIYKERTGTSNWWVWHTSFATASNALQLNTTGAILSGAYFGTQTSSVVAFSGVQTGLSTGFVAYCFAPIAGYSAFGSYTGNGSTDGTFVYTGFRPKFVMFKRTDSSNDWVFLDTARNTFNVMTSALFPNSSSSETSNGFYDSDCVSNGFKIRATNAVVNASGGTYIYMAFAESPFKYANAR